MIKIKYSSTAGKGFEEFKTLTRDEIIDSIFAHTGDVELAMKFFIYKMINAFMSHDEDKVKDFDNFRKDIESGFQAGVWLNKHLKGTRHHLNRPEGVPSDVNLIDVLEYIADCTVAGFARSGSVTPIKIQPDVLIRAFNNTAELLKKEIVLIK